MTRWKQQLGVISVMLALTMHAVNVRDFGAAGDGNTDDTAAVQRALDAALREAREAAQKLDAAMTGARERLESAEAATITNCYEIAQMKRRL